MDVEDAVFEGPCAAAPFGSSSSTRRAPDKSGTPPKDDEKAKSGLRLGETRAAAEESTPTENKHVRIDSDSVELFIGTPPPVAQAHGGVRRAIDYPSPDSVPDGKRYR